MLALGDDRNQPLDIALVLAESPGRDLAMKNRAGDVGIVGRDLAETLRAVLGGQTDKSDIAGRERLEALDFHVFPRGSYRRRATYWKPAPAWKGECLAIVSAAGFELLCRTATKGACRQSMASRFQRNVLTGLLTVVPLWVTWIVFEFVLELLARFGSPAANWLARQFDTEGSVVSAWLLDPWFQWTLAIVITILGLYCLGLAASFVIGRRIISWIDSTLERLPFVKKVYGATK